MFRVYAFILFSILSSIVSAETFKCSTNRSGYFGCWEMRSCYYNELLPGMSEKTIVEFTPDGKYIQRAIFFAGNSCSGPIIFTQHNESSPMYYQNVVRDYGVTNFMIDYDGSGGWSGHVFYMINIENKFCIHKYALKNLDKNGGFSYNAQFPEIDGQVPESEFQCFSYYP